MLHKGVSQTQRKCSLVGYQKTLHPSTLTIVRNLGNLYADQGRLGDAKRMYDRARTGRKIETSWLGARGLSRQVSWSYISFDVPLPWSLSLVHPEDGIRIVRERHAERKSECETKRLVKGGRQHLRISLILYIGIYTIM